MTDVAIIGGGPAGLIAAEMLSEAGAAVTVFDRMPSVGRKFLMTGRGGLNLTHSEPLDAFLARYTALPPQLEGAIRAFPPEALRSWAEELGEETFVGSSGRVFPRSFKASPLLRAWLRRLSERGVTLRTRHAWRGWTHDGALAFDTPDGPFQVRPRATLLALGGGSWPKLGSDAGWVPLLAAKGITITPLAPSNMAVCVPWSDTFRSRFAGEPVKRVRLRIGASVQSEMVITQTGLEGGAIYALSHAIRTACGSRDATLQLDLKPALDEPTLAERLSRPRRGETASNFLRKTLALSPVHIGLLREAAGRMLPEDAAALAALVKNAALPVTGTKGLARAISTAGGIAFSEVDGDFALRALPGVFVAGEMLDWEAPTGGYLLQAAFATGACAALGIRKSLSHP